MLNKRGLLIGVEGIDGAGKTSLCQSIKYILGVKGYKNVLLVREPTNEPYFGTRIRQILSSDEPYSKRELFELFRHDREHLYKYTINKALKKDYIVLMDRTYLSTACYQSDVEPFEKILEDNILEYPAFDRLYVLDIPVMDALKRLKKKKTLDRFENEETLNRAYLNYLRAYTDPEDILKIKLINAMNTFEEINLEIFEDLVTNFL